GARFCGSCGVEVHDGSSVRATPATAAANDGSSRLAQTYITQALEAVGQQDTARATQLVDRALLAQPTNQEALSLRAQLTGPAIPRTAGEAGPGASGAPSANYVAAAAPGGVRPRGSRTMSFDEAIRTCLSKYASFSGRASRAEYWWWVLAVILLQVGLFAVAIAAGETSLAAAVGLAWIVVVLGTFLPSIAAAVRRLHDTDRSGSWLLLVFVPFGSLVLIVLLAQAGYRGPTRYGPQT
ncbi:MAG: DUF805 domain-containing protein, partial [Chloroflexi bacterium]|nr:DUF805 domain-containing protein [Chloroflexota bacterium]